MLKTTSTILLVLILFCLNISAQTLSEKDYLKLNKEYTEVLLEYLMKEQTNTTLLEQLKSLQAQANSTLNRSKSNLTSTVEQIRVSDLELISLKNKQTNKTQIEARLNSEKQQNLTSISRLDGQIITVSQSLQNLDFEISNLENQKSLIETRLNTQEQLLRVVQNNINSLERENSNNQSQIDQNDRQVSNLRRDIESLRLQREASTDPAEKQDLQQQIARIRDIVQNLEDDSRLKQSSIQNNQIRLISERSQSNQIESVIRSLNIENSGNRSILSSLNSQQRQIETQINSLKTQISTLKTSNRSIDSEISLLSRLPQEINRVETITRTLNLQKTQNETLVATHQAAFDLALQNTIRLQTEMNTNKENLLSAETNHSLILNQYQTHIANLIPTLVPSSAGFDNLENVQPMLQSRDWSVYKASFSTLSDKNICSASTRVIDSELNTLSELYVLKIINADGSYSSPFIVMTQSSNANSVYSGVLKTDRNQSYNLTLFQSPLLNEIALISNFRDISSLIGSLRADNRATVEFFVPGSSKPVQFSLRGSSNAINEMLNKCK